MPERRKYFEKVLRAFPASIRDILQTIPMQGGRLSAQQSERLSRVLGIDSQELMVCLLPLAKSFAQAPLSRFQVGAVAAAGGQDPFGPLDLYLGANIEFGDQALDQTIHAEQSATLNAWQHGAQSLHVVAVSAPPCGYCRQFLHEFETHSEIKVLISAGDGETYRKTSLCKLLPNAISPSDLGNPAGPLACTARSRKLSLNVSDKDPSIAQALLAAEKSYAPYTGNFAGCAIQTSSKEIYSGCNVESVAFNPSLTPLQTAILRMNMALPKETQAVQRVVLVERLTKTSQRRAVEGLLASWAPSIALEYHQVEEYY